MRSVIGDVCERPFNDTIHLYRHLNYLFRSGAYADQVNEYTHTNLLWLSTWLNLLSDGFWRRFPATAEERQGEHDVALLTLKDDFATNNLADCDAYKQLYMAYFPDLDVDTATTITQKVHVALREKDLGKVEMAVVHRDQESPDHLHILFRWTARKPHAKSRLKALGI